MRCGNEHLSIGLMQINLYSRQFFPLPSQKLTIFSDFSMKVYCADHTYGECPMGVLHANTFENLRFVYLRTHNETIYENENNKLR